MKKYVFADKFFYHNFVEETGFLEINDGKFGEYYHELPDLSAEVLDYTGYYIAPGLVDTHIHGFAGVDVMDNEPKKVVTTMSDNLLSCGVTSFLATTLTADKKTLHDVVVGLGEHYKKTTGAKLRGIYLEGPYFTEEYKGAQNPEYMRDPDLNEFHDWQKASHNLIKKIGLAPERLGTPEFISELVKEGVVVALGHSDATLEQTLLAVEAGASVWVHAYNGMRAFNHREPGILGAVLSLSENYAELICDGHHIHPQAVKILIDKLGVDHIALITDCMRAGGLPNGNYTLGEFPVVVAEGTARLASGNLAGSILKLNEAVKNVYNWGIATAEEAIKMATYVPALSSNLDQVCGKINAGFDADFIVLKPDLSLVATFVNGKKRFEA